jgi:CheY-like chemotaxis protein
MAEVLLIDDDARSLSGNAACLTARGHLVRSHDVLADAVREVCGNPPDCLVLEITSEQGPASVDTARAVARQFPALPVIVLTRADEQFDAAELARQDIDGWLPVRRYLQKPVAPEVLADEVEHAIGDPPAGAIPRPDSTERGGFGCHRWSPC